MHTLGWAFVGSGNGLPMLFAQRHWQGLVTIGGDEWCTWATVLVYLWDEGFQGHTGLEIVQIHY